jgi:hypothetical protein
MILFWKTNYGRHAGKFLFDYFPVAKNYAKNEGRGTLNFLVILLSIATMQAMADWSTWHDVVPECIFTVQ